MPITDRPTLYIFILKQYYHNFTPAPLMSLPFLRSPLTVLALALAVTSLHAQTPAATEPTVTVKFRVVTWQSGSPATFSYKNNNKSIAVTELYAETRSKSYDYTGPETLYLYPAAPPATTTPATTPAEPPKPIARISIPTTIRYPLFILVPNPAGPEPYRAVVFDDSPEVFPFQSYFLVNYSQKRVAASIGQSRVLIEAGQSHLAVSKDKVLNFMLGVSLEENGGWKLIYDDFFPNWPDLRTVIFIVDDTRGTRPRLMIRSLLENRAVWDAEQKTKAPAKIPQS